MTFEHILIDETDAVATITINRPDRLNAMSQQTLAELTAAVDQVRDEGRMRAMILTGSGRAFCSGADLAQSLDPNDMGAGLEKGFNPLIERLRALPIPLVTAVNGAAAGGGCAYALAGDIAIAARSAYFLQPFAAIGLTPDVGATWLLPRLVGQARAMGMMLLGERVYADQAEQWGLIWKAVDDDQLMTEARAVAVRLASGPTVALGLTRQAVHQAATLSLTDTLMLERRNQRTAGRTADHREGVAAFREKRPPRFTGR